MKKYIILLITLFLLTSTAVFAKETKLPEYPEASAISIGSGAHWGGMIGANPVTVEEGSQFGFTIGAGWSDVERDPFGWNAGIVYRFMPEAGLFVSYGTAGVYGYESEPGTYRSTADGFTISFGSIPVDSFDFVWRIGVGFLDDEFSNGDTVFDIGIGIAF